MSFGVSAADLVEAVSERTTDGLPKVHEWGGALGLAKLLSTSCENGLSAADLAGEAKEKREEALGTNTFEYPPPKSLLELIIVAFDDLCVRILCVAAVVSLAIGAGLEEKRAEYGYLEGVAIIIVVIVVVMTSSLIDYAKELKFQQLNSVKDNFEVEAVRDGKAVKVSASDILVGDVVRLFQGDKVPADGIFIEGSDLKVNESAMTGEPIDIHKTQQKDPFLVSGTAVTEGTGTMLVVAVGSRSQWGVILKKLQDPPEDTALQERLDNLVVVIGRFGTAAAIATFIASMIRWIIIGVRDDEWDGMEVLNYLINSVTIVVVAIPEGLPLAITLGLAFAMRKMMEDQNLVRRLEACETMGSATQLNADKTGTLTQNLMTVVEGFVDLNLERQMPPKDKTFSEKYTKTLAESICANSTASLSVQENGKVEHIGNKTECAMLGLVQELGEDYVAVRKANPPTKLYLFTSAKKRMSTIVKRPGATSPSQQRLYCKGASEIVLGLCTNVMLADGSIKELTADDVREGMAGIMEMATRGLRTLCIAYREVDHDPEDAAFWEEAPERDLTLLALVGIKDPIRPETAPAVKLLRNAGVTVRMVTGDNAVTASSIAKEAGILDEGGLVMEGPVFRKLPPDEMKRIANDIQVLARSSPNDKLILCAAQRQIGEVVAVTGDGTNDAPALKEADVGFALGIAGTEIAKEACDIVIMDDNVKSMAQAVLWGRNVFQSIRKFLQFQLVVNVVAVTLNFISACAGVALPLAAVPLLWVNMIMDSMGALALATEPPSPDLMKQQPFGRVAPLVNRQMQRNIIGMSIYQLIVCLVLLFAGKEIFDLPCKDLDHGHAAAGDDCPGTTLEINSIIFNAFVFMQIFSEVNSRKIEDKNIFADIWKSDMFILIIAATIVIQVLFMEAVGRTVVGPAIGFQNLTGGQWIVCLVIGIVSLPVGFLTRLLPLDWFPGRLDSDPVPAEEEEQQGEEEAADAKKAGEAAAEKEPAGGGVDAAEVALEAAEEGSADQVAPLPPLSKSDSQRRWGKVRAMTQVIAAVNTMADTALQSKMLARGRSGSLSSEGGGGRSRANSWASTTGLPPSEKDEDLPTAVSAAFAAAAAEMLPTSTAASALPISQPEPVKEAQPVTPPAEHTEEP